MSGFLDDLDAILWSGAYVLFVLGLAEVLRRRGVPRSFTRKVVHVGIGTWVLPTFLLFEHRFWAVAAPAAFIVVNALSYRFHLIRSVEGEERNVGTILYPLSVTLALALAWESPWPAVGASAVMVMAWGDAAASLIGRRWGRRIYRVQGHPRSLEGSVAMTLLGWAGILVSFWVLGPAPSGPLVGAALGVAVLAAGVEAVSQWGFDNLLVPAVTAAGLVLAHGSVWS